MATAEGNGPVNALDSALRQAIGAHFPNLGRIHLIDYRVRVLDTGRGTGAVTRVLIDTTDGERRLDDDRRLGEHHRGVLAGPFRLDRLRSRPRRPGGSRQTGRPRPVVARRTMTQPSFVPIVEADQVRPAYRLQTPLDWRQGRVAELRGPGPPAGRELGVPGPDQGYALLVAHELFEERLELSAGITAEDALVGCAAVASARAALFGRAPVGKDVELALVLFGFLGERPPDLVAWRTPLFQAAAHHYRQQRRHRRGRARDDAPAHARHQVRAKLSDVAAMLTRRRLTRPLSLAPSLYR